MKFPESGWVLIRSEKQPAIFTPTQKNQNPFTYDSFKGQIGSSLTTLFTTKVTNKLSPYHLPVRVVQQNPQQILVGPLIGILTSDGNRLFRGNHKNFADLIRTGRKMGVTVFVLTPKSFQKQKSYIQGFLLDPRFRNNRWLKMKLPLPNVIYNRIPNRMAENRIIEQNILKRLKKNPKIHLFNTGFFNKWHLYQLLQAHEEWSFMVPSTKPLDQIYTLENMLKQHSYLYAKPINGKAGLGLMKITKDHTQYQLIYQDNKGHRRYRFNDLVQLWKLIQEKKQNRDYVLQQGIPLATWQHRPCDFRVLIQKDLNGNWDLTGIGVRVAGKNAISTHVPMGGSIANVHQVLKTLFPQNENAVYQKLARKTMEIAKYIEKSYATPMGEMSMDIGIETNGRIWFFEANSKPMKFDEPSIRKLSLQRIIQYSLFLSGFSKSLRGNDR